MELKYINNFGEELNLTDWPYMIQSEDTYDYAYDYDAINGRRGGKITGFSKGVKERPLEIMVHATSAQDFAQIMTNFYNVVERDVLANTPGRLVLNGVEYMTGFVIASHNQFWSQGIRTALREVTFLTPYPFWVREVVYSFDGAESGAVSVSGLDYDYDYEYDLAETRAADVVENENLGAADFEMRIQGPATNPRVRIGAQVYQVNAVIGLNDTLVINSREKTVINYKASGEQINLLNERVEGIFNKIPPGRQPIEKNFAAFDFVLFIERSEPIWIL